jgi:hypothetical protein
MKAAYRLLEQSAKLRKMRRECIHQSVKNIMLLIELDTIAEDPGSKKAQDILEKYRLKIQQRKEIEQAEQN